MDFSSGNPSRYLFLVSKKGITIGKGKEDRPSCIHGDIKAGIGESPSR